MAETFIEKMEKAAGITGGTTPKPPAPKPVPTPNPVGPQKPKVYKFGKTYSLDELRFNTELERTGRNRTYKGDAGDVDVVK